MIDLYLSAPDAATINAALIEAGLLTEDLTPAEGVSLDVIGEIIRFVDDEPVRLEGWHVNLRCEALTDAQAASVEPFRVYPKQPYRVWA